MVMVHTPLTWRIRASRYGVVLYSTLHIIRTCKYAVCVQGVDVDTSTIIAAFVVVVMILFGSKPVVPFIFCAVLIHWNDGHGVCLVVQSRSVSCVGAADTALCHTQCGVKVQEHRVCMSTKEVRPNAASIWDASSSSPRTKFGTNMHACLRRVVAVFPRRVFSQC